MRNFFLCLTLFKKLSSRCFLEFKEHSTVYLSTCQIVGYGILVARNISHPIIAIDVIDAK